MKHAVERIRRQAFTRRVVLVAFAFAFALSPLAACNFTPPSTVRGEEGRVAFRSPIGTEVFEQRLVVGATIGVTAVAIDDEENALVASAELTSTDPAVLEVLVSGAAGASIRTAGPGEAHLEVVAADEVLDRILIRAARPVLVELTERQLAGSDVDPRLPYEFALVDGALSRLGVVATDLCGDALVTAGAVRLESSDPSFVSVVDDDEGTGLYAASAGAAEVALRIGDAGVGEHVVFAVEEPEVDALLLEATATNGVNTNLWARAFSQGLECLGAEFAWEGTEDVVLSVDGGAPVARATLGFDAQATLADGGVLEDGAGVVTVSAADLEAAVDVVAPPHVNDDPRRVEPYSPPVSTGCDPESAQCDPYAAAAFGALWAGRRRLRPLRGRG